MMRASMLVLSAASFVVLATRIALAATFKSFAATKGAITGPHPTNRKYAYLAAAPLSALLVCLVSSSVLAHQTGYEADANHDGYVEVYRTDGFHGDWKAYRKMANKQLKRYTDEPLIRMVSSKARAEVWVHKDRDLTGCFGTRASYFKYKLDEVRVSPVCSNYEGLFSHEVGHVYGLPAGKIGDGTPEDNHHRCTPYWQKRAVDVGETPGDGIKGCHVKIVGFGIHDLNTLAKPG
jgi:hypothetical protein